MELFNGQLHQQQPGVHPNALVNPLCDSPRVDFAPIPQTPVDLSPSAPTTRIYPHPYVNSRVDSSSDDDDLPPRPRGFRNKATPLVGLTRRPSPRRNRNLHLPRAFDILDLQRLLWENDPGAARRYQWFIIPDDMYWPWGYGETEANRIIFDADSNPIWNMNKSRLVEPGDGKTELFSVYNRAILEEQVKRVQLSIEKSHEAAQVDSSYEKIRDDAKIWSIGCDFTIFSRSERLGLQDTPIVPFNLHGTCAAARSFLNSEHLMRKLAHLELCSVFEIPPVSISADLAKIAYAFYKGEEVPENVESLPTSPLAIPKEFRIDDEGHSDRAKVIASKPLSLPNLQLFLQDVLISNHLEQVHKEQRKTMCGHLRVHRHSTYADTKDKLRVHERDAGNRIIQQTPKDRKKRQKLRNEAWWANLEMHTGKTMEDFSKAAKSKWEMCEVTGFEPYRRYGESRDEDDGDTTTEAGEGDTNELVDDIIPAPAEVGEGSGINTQAAESENIPEQTGHAINAQAVESENIPEQTENATNAQSNERQNVPEQSSNATKSKKSKGKGKAKKSKTTTETGGGNTTVGESSTILQPSESDVAVTNSPEIEIAPEANSITAPQLSPKVAVEGSSSVVNPAPAQPTTSIPSRSPTEGKSKKNKKKKKGQNTHASNDTPSGSASQGKSVNKSTDVQASKSTPGSVSQGQFVHETKAVSVSGQSVNKPSGVIPAQELVGASSGESTTSGAVLSLDALGISVPMDSEDGAWETVKSRSAQKAKANVSSANPVVKGGLKTSTPGAEVNQQRIQQGSRVVSPLTETGPPSKATSVVKPTAVQPKDVRIFDPNEYPAMPTPLSVKTKTQVKDVHDSEPPVSPASQLATSAKKVAPVTPAVIPKVVSGTVTPNLETLNNSATQIDSDPEDLYGASPPRKIRAAADSKVKDISSQSVAAAQGVSKPAVPDSVTQTAKGKKTSVGVSNDGFKVDKKPESAPTSDKKSVSGAKVVATSPQVDKPAGLKSSAPAADGKKTASDAKVETTVLKVDPKVSTNKSKGKGKQTPTVAKSSNAGTASNESKGKGKAPAVSSEVENVVAPAVAGSINHTKGKGNASDTKAKSAVGQVSDSTHVADSSNPSSTGPEVPAVSKKNKKTTHKHMPKSKASRSGQPSTEKSTALPAQSKQPAVTGNVAASANVVSVDAPNNGATKDFAVDKKPVDKAPTAAEADSEKIAKPASAKHVPTVQYLPATQSAEVNQKADVKDKKQEVAPVPADLAWADLVSPTKPGYLKKRRCSVDNTQDDDDLEVSQPSPVRHSSISTGNASGQRVLQSGQLPTLAVSSSTSDDPFTTGDTVQQKEPDVHQQKDPEVSFTSSSTDGEIEQRDSRASPEVHITPRTELMFAPASPETYNGEPYVNKNGDLVTLFRRDAEISNFPGQKHHQRTHSGPGYGNQFAVPAPNPVPQGRSGYGSGRSGHSSNFNTGQGSHGHPPPAVYGTSKTTGYVVHQGGQQGSSSSSSLGGDLKGRGQDMGMQGSMASQGLSPIPEASIGSEVESEDGDDYNPPTKCTFCEQVKAPTATNPFHFCPLCGVIPGSPFYCSRACLLANAWEHSQVCRHVPPYMTNMNTDFGPTYRMEAFPMNNLHWMPDSAEKYRQKTFAMFCKYGEVPDIHAAHVSKWPGIDWARILPSRERSRVGDYHIFKSQATHTSPNLSRSHVICTIKFPLDDGVGFKRMITRALNVALVTHDTNVIQFLGRLLRLVLMDPRYFANFGAIEPQEIVMVEFKSQFYKEFGFIYNEAEPMMPLQVSWKNIEPALMYYELRHGVLQFWLNTLYTQG